MLHAFTPTDSTSACSLSGFHWVSRYFRTVTIRTCHRALIDLRLPACSTPPARPSRNRTELPFTPGCTLGRPVSLFRVGYISVSWLLNSSSPPILVQVSPVVRCKYMSATACRTKKPCIPCSGFVRRIICRLCARQSAGREFRSPPHRREP